MSFICILVKLNIFFLIQHWLIYTPSPRSRCLNLGPYLFKIWNCTRTWCSLLYTLMILHEAGYKTFCVRLHSFYWKLSSSAFGKSVSSSSTIFYTNVATMPLHKFVFSVFLSLFQWCLSMSNLLNHLPVFVFVYLFFQRQILLKFCYANSIFRLTNLSTILRWPKLLFILFYTVSLDTLSVHLIESVFEVYMK